MNFSAWSIRNPVPAVLLFALLTIFGLYGVNRLSIQDFPDMDLPAVVIAASLEGAAPAQLESEVARKIEDKLASLPLLDHVTTTITDGSVEIVAIFKLEKNSEEALNEVRNAVDAARANMPARLNSPLVAKVNTVENSLLTYAVDAPNMREDELSWFIDNDIAKALRAVSGVATVPRLGGVDREVHVDLDPALMAGMGVTIAELSAQLRAVQQNASGGRAEIGGQLQSFRVPGAVRDVDEVAALQIPLSDGRRIRLDQVARVSDSHAERTTLSFFDGKPMIGFQIKRQRGFSDVSVAADVREAVKTFSAKHPQIAIREVSNTVQPILDKYHDSMHLLYEGALLAVIVVWIFLRDWRATVISATALPLSIIPTFMVMQWMGFSLNGVSLLALALVIGILVDDAIVEVENIARHQWMGKTPYQAALEAADEIGLAVIATTFTLVAVFLPTAFMGGIPGLIFRQFGLTAAVAVLASLLVARLLTPMMAAHFLKAPKHEKKPDSALMKRYLGWVSACLRHRGRTVAAAFAFFALSMALTPWLSTSFLPPSDSGKSHIGLTLPPGSTLEQTRALTEKASRMLLEMPEVTQVFAAVGTPSTGGDSSGAPVNGADLFVSLKPRGERRKKTVVEQEMRERLTTLPGVRVMVGWGGNGATLDVTLGSDDSDALARAASALEHDMRSLKGVGAVTSGAALQRPEIQIVPDVARAAELGVTVDALADTVRLATYGDYASSLNKLNLPQRQVSVRVRLDPALRGDLERIGALRVKGSQGLVALSSVADIRIGSGPSQIDRIDRFRNITVSVELNGRPLGDVMRELRDKPTLKSLPVGVHQVEQGELQFMNDMMGGFGFAMAIGILCIYVVLVLLFHDFLQPVTILMALPLAVGGALVALLLVGSSFGMPAVIGVLMLMGIVTKNSILLVEYAVMARREHGMSRFDALIDACHKRSRPILMTTIAMGAGMLPVALGMGADPGFRQPMAVVVIGGLLTSTLLSLLVIPVAYTLVDDFAAFFARRIGLGRHRRSASPEHP